jgi:hypothetical protein
MSGWEEAEPLVMASRPSQKECIGRYIKSWAKRFLRIEGAMDSAAATRFGFGL